jgi:tryptophan synthase beta chain
MNVSQLQRTSGACGQGRATQRVARSHASARAGRSLSVRVAAVAAPEKPVTEYQRPDASGRYGRFGGKYVPETLIPALEQLEIDFKEAIADPAFKARRAMMQPALRPSSAYRPAAMPYSPLAAFVHAGGTSVSGGPYAAQAEMDDILKDYVGRETPLYHAVRLSNNYKT